MKKVFERTAHTIGFLLAVVAIVWIGVLVGRPEEKSGNSRPSPLSTVLSDMPGFLRAPDSNTLLHAWERDRDYEETFAS
jgi:hypothetical protein